MEDAIIAIINWFPYGSFPANVSDSIQLILNYMYVWDFIFPISTLLSITVLVITFEILLWMWRMFKWTLQQVTNAL